MGRIRTLLTLRFGKEIRKHSMIYHEELMTAFLKLAGAKSMAEIGTLHGVSASLFASLGMKVATVDIVKSPIAEEIWNYLEVIPLIDYLVCKDDMEKIDFFSSKDFDIAFIDGDHHVDKVKVDFECVKRCGLVCFHDYKPHSPHFQPLVGFIDSLYPTRFTFGEQESLFAVWIAEDDPRRNNVKLMDWLRDSSEKGLD